MTSHLNSHGTTDIKPEMLSGVQTGYGTPHFKYNIRGIAHTRTNRKDDIFTQRRLVQNFTFIMEWGQGTCSLTKHTWRWAYSRYIFPACCLLRFAAFFGYTTVMDPPFLYKLFKHSIFFRINFFLTLNFLIQNAFGNFLTQCLFFCRTKWLVDATKIKMHY